NEVTRRAVLTAGRTPRVFTKGVARTTSNAADCNLGWLGQVHSIQLSGRSAKRAFFSRTRKQRDAPVARTGALIDRLWQDVRPASSVRQRRTLSNGSAPATHASLNMRPTPWYH